MMNSKIRTVMLSLVLASALVQAPALAQDEGAEPVFFKDWGKACRKPDGAPKAVCFVFQNAVLEEKNQPLMNVLIHYPDDQPQPVMVLTLPLGVALRPGIRVQVDEGEALSLPFYVCVTGGCKAALALDEKTLAGLKRGNQLHVTIAALQGKPTRLTTSLRGFTAAMNALK